MQHSGDWDYFWLIFRNGKYERTIEPVRPLIVEYPYEGTTADRLGDWPITDESRSGKALAACGLTAKQIEGEVTAPIPHGNPWNVLPAAIAVQLAVGHRRLAAANEQDARQIENTAKLAVRYEPSSIRLGMTPERVGILFQAPLRSWSLGGGRRAAIYGAANYLDESPLWNGTRFAVIFDHSKVVEVLGSAFYNDQWYEEPRRSKRHGASHRFPARNVIG